MKLVRASCDPLTRQRAKALCAKLGIESLDEVEVVTIEWLPVSSEEICDLMDDEKLTPEDVVEVEETWLAVIGEIMDRRADPNLSSPPRLLLAVKQRGRWNYHELKDVVAVYDPPLPKQTKEGD